MFFIFTWYLCYLWNINSVYSFSVFVLNISYSYNIMIYVGKRICTSSLFDEHPVFMQNTFYVSNTGKTYLPLFLHVFVIGIQYLCKILNTFYISNTGKTNSHVFVISIQYLCTASFSRLVTLALILAQLRQHCSCMKTMRRANLSNLSNLLVWRKGNLSNFPTFKNDEAKLKYRRLTAPD